MRVTFSSAIPATRTDVVEFDQGVDMPWIRINYGGNTPQTSNGVCNALVHYWMGFYAQGTPDRFFGWLKKPEGIKTIMNDHLLMFKGFVSGKWGTALQKPNAATRFREDLLLRFRIVFESSVPIGGGDKDFDRKSFILDLARTEKNRCTFKHVSLHKPGGGGHAIATIVDKSAGYFALFDPNEGVVAFNDYREFVTFLSRVTDSYYTTIYNAPYGVTNFVV